MKRAAVHVLDFAQLSGFQRDDGIDNVFANASGRRPYDPQVLWSSDSVRLTAEVRRGHRFARWHATLRTWGAPWGMSPICAARRPVRC